EPLYGVAGVAGLTPGSAGVAGSAPLPAASVSAVAGPIKSLATNTSPAGLSTSSTVISWPVFNSLIATLFPLRKIRLSALSFSKYSLFWTSTVTVPASRSTTTTLPEQVKFCWTGLACSCLASSAHRTLVSSGMMANRTPMNATFHALNITINLSISFAVSWQADRFEQENDRQPLNAERSVSKRRTKFQPSASNLAQNLQPQRFCGPGRGQR